MGVGWGQKYVVMTTKRDRHQKRGRKFIVAFIRHLSWARNPAGSLTFVLSNSSRGIRFRREGEHILV